MIKSGIKTTEFWITALSNIAGAILAILAAYGVIVDNDASLWQQLINSILVAIIPIALAIVNSVYINSRTQLKKNEPQI